MRQTRRAGSTVQTTAAASLTITDIPQANVDATEKSLSFQGTAGQVALAEWLFTNLDKPTSVPQSGAKHEYRVSDSADDVVRVFYLTNPDIPQGVQEIATVVRSLASIRWMFTYNDLRAIVVRILYTKRENNPRVSGSGDAGSYHHPIALRVHLQRTSCSRGARHRRADCFGQMALRRFGSSQESGLQHPPISAPVY